MKKILITQLLLLLCLASFSQVASTPQNWDYEVRGKHESSIKKDKLAEAKTMSDIMVSYPVLWITSYVSVEITATCDGKTVKAMGTNDVLTEEQKGLLSKADLSTDVIINIVYKCKNAVTDNIETSKMKYITTVVPEIEAEYLSGAEGLQLYIKANAVDVIALDNPQQMMRALVKFNVNEEGEISDVILSKTSGDEKIDKLLLEAVSKMPRWKPATNADGTKVKQGFEFSLNTPNVGGC